MHKFFQSALMAVALSWTANFSAVQTKVDGCFWYTRHEICEWMASAQPRIACKVVSNGTSKSQIA